MNVFRPTFALCAALFLGAQDPAPLALPKPIAGTATLHAALAGRTTVRNLAGPALTLAEAGQLLWAAQGENRPGKRTVPSARAKYPLEVYLLTAGGPGLPAGLYHYAPAGHTLVKSLDGTPEKYFGAIANMQPWIKAAPSVFVVAGDPTRIGTSAAALNQTFYEAGAAAQALLLQATAMNLGAGTAMGVDLEGVTKFLNLPAGLQTLVLLPVGHPKA